MLTLTLTLPLPLLKPLPRLFRAVSLLMRSPPRPVPSQTSAA